MFCNSKSEFYDNATNIQGNTMTSESVFIALDFDGVLHHHCGGTNKTDVFDPMNGAKHFVAQIQSRFPTVIDEPYFDADGHLFDREHVLIDLLQRLPQAKIVISTSWRNKIPLPYLVEFLSLSVRERVVGVLDSSEAECKDGIRGQLMVKWLARRKQSDAIWIALDDQPRHYSKNSDHVVATHWRGMTGDTVDKAVQKVNLLRNSRKAANGLSLFRTNGRLVAIVKKISLIHARGLASWIVRALKLCAANAKPASLIRKCQGWYPTRQTKLSPNIVNRELLDTLSRGAFSQSVNKCLTLKVW